MESNIFSPNFSVVGRVSPTSSVPALERETGVYSATPEFVKLHCGPIAIGILECVPESYYAEADKLGLYTNIDVRIHRLYPGDFPAYPGWHCDGEFRETYFSQPDMNRIQVHNHLVCTVSSNPEGVSNTKFLSESITVETDKPSQDHTLWGQVDSYIRNHPHLQTWDSSDGELIQFDSWTPHCCCPTKIRGWRLFFRMSMWHRPNLGDGGMVSRQEQVYKLCEGSGW